MLQQSNPFARLSPVIGGLLITGIVLLGAYLMTIVTRQNKPVNCKISHVDARKVINSDFDVRELWSLDAKVPNFSSYSPLAISDNILIVAQRCDEVTGINLDKGDIVWYSETVVTASDLALDTRNNQIYISAQEQVRAINISTGQTNWVNQSQILKKNSPPVRVLPSGKVIAYARYAGIRYLNPSNGVLTDAISLPKGTFLLDDGVAFAVADKGAIQAFDLNLNKVIWKSGNILDSTLSLENMRPDTQENLLILRETSFLSHVIFVDKNTGEKLWDTSTNRIVSNVYIYNDHAYMLTDNAELLVLNSQTGAQVGTIEFAAAIPAELLYSEKGIGGSWVAAVDDMIFVYFQDTDVLSAYKIKTKNPLTNIP
jgi:outer membrane protein assembly factor BamB